MNPVRKMILKASAAAAATALGASAHALTTTIDTTLLEANSTLTFSQAALDALSLTDTTVMAGGYARSLGTNASGLTAFNLPVTSLTADIGLLPPSLTPTAAKVTGSALTFLDGGNGKMVSFSNLAINFDNSTIYGDFTSSTGTVSQLDLFTFKVTAPLSFSLNGGVSLTESMGDIYMTSDAVNAFKTGLGLPKAVTLVLPTVNFGTIDAKIVPWVRSTPLVNVPAVPEPSTYAVFGIGLAMAGIAARRQLTAG
jgi:hypothetical protein